MKGTIFSIEEFAVHDGSGVRVNVFFKGCPLRCKWCHNPEGWETAPKIVKNPNGCIHCGTCEHVCMHKDKCVLCKQCIYNCPRDLIRISGEVWESDDLAQKLNSYKSVLDACEGGLTFSGGEVLMQSRFLCELLDKTSSMHRIIETSGYGDGFDEVIKRLDFVYYDLKLMDSEKHKYYTGRDNSLILKNADMLMRSDIPFAIRIPLIDNVNCDIENMKSVCEFLKPAKNLAYAELLPYNVMAGAKYPLAGLKYEYGEFTQPSGKTLDELSNVLDMHKIPFKIRGRANR